MSLTGTQLLTGFGRFIGDEYDPAGLSTSAAGDSSGTTLIDDTLGEFDDDALVGRWVRITQSGGTQYQVRRIVKNQSVSGLVEVRPAFSAQIATSTTYELHRHDPRLKFTALDEARVRVFPSLAQTVYDDTTTADGISRVYAIPSTMRQGPFEVMVENPLEADVNWNVLSSPLGDSTTDWTAASLTASTVSYSDSDRLVPKYDSAIKMVVAGSTNGTYKQAVSAMDITAAAAADREMTFAAWVYCTEASRLTVTIEDDAGESSSSTHSGNGWELLTVEKTIDGDNATTLTVGFDVASSTAPVTAFWEKAWFYFGAAERVRDGHYNGAVNQRVRRDSTTQQVYLQAIPPRGYQLRFTGRETLSALGTTVSTQVTNTMEVDEENAQILYADAARILFDRLGFNVSDFSELSAKITLANEKRAEMKSTFGQQTTKTKVTGMWA